LGIRNLPLGSGAMELDGFDPRHDLMLQPLEVVERLRHRHVPKRRPDEQQRQPSPSAA
jgi:hypothetical protein